MVLKCAGNMNRYMKIVDLTMEAEQVWKIFSR